MILRKLFFNLYYFFKPPWDTGITPPELVEFVSKTPPARALDIGCGTGTNAIMLAKNGWKVTGLDFARRAIQIARQKARKAGVEVDFLIGDASRMEGIIGSFDLILDIGCLHSLSPGNRHTYREKMFNLLAPDGTYLLYAFLLPQDAESGPGLDQNDLDHLRENLDLVDRADGTDRGRINSVWMKFRHLVRDGNHA